MKILIVTDNYTHPTISGNRKCILEQMNLLKELGVDVYLLHLQTGFKTTTAYIETKKYWGNHFFEYKLDVYHLLLERLINMYRKKCSKWTWKADDARIGSVCKYINRLNLQYRFDACIIQYYWLYKIAAKINIQKIALMTHDCFSYKNLALDLQCYRSTTPNEEAKALQNIKHIFAIQDEEAIFFKKLSPKSLIYTIYSKYQFYKQPIKLNSNILFFSGPNDFNLNGIHWFITEILPLIKKRNPSIRLIIGGGISNKICHKYNDSNIEFKGYIENSADFYELGNIVINPVYQGTGLKIKTFEALSFGKVVLAHPHSAEGIFKKESAPIFFSKNPHEWSDFINRIISDEEMILTHQQQACQYICGLNEYITNEYQRFLQY